MIKSKEIARKYLPAGWIDHLRHVKKLTRRMVWRIKVALGRKPPSDVCTIIDNLLALGLKQGVDCMVHSSLSSIGNVVGGPHSVICGLKQVMGPDATLLMPAYAMKGNMYETMINPAPFDVKKSRSTMGAITEAFRTMPDVFRSAHPTHSVCASGPKAKEYTEKHHLSRSPCGPGSPFQLLSQCHGYILCIGSGIGKITFHHIIEDKVDYFPERVYLPEMHKKRVIFHDGHSEEIEVLVHDPALGSRRVDADAGKEDEILEEMRRRGIVHEGLIGQAKCHLINAESLEDMLLDLLRKGVTIYRNKKEASI